VATSAHRGRYDGINVKLQKAGGCAWPEDDRQGAGLKMRVMLAA